MIHRTDAELDQRLRAASCLMLRSVAPLVASLDKLKHLPIDDEEQPYATAAGRGAVGLAVHAGTCVCVCACVSVSVCVHGFVEELGAIMAMGHVAHRSEVCMYICSYVYFQIHGYKIGRASCRERV